MWLKCTICAPKEVDQQAVCIMQPRLSSSDALFSAKNACPCPAAAELSSQPKNQVFNLLAPLRPSGGPAGRVKVLALSARLLLLLSPWPGGAAFLSTKLLRWRVTLRPGPLPGASAALLSADSGCTGLPAALLSALP